ncbi:PucR family transcriptional regulator [Nocardia violaceofusca]|uniref:PucR family transcriptional regulator n=2 Tax=Nocardia TaxID=1817 RepID=UPI0007A558A9|nr:helix-turn-helix domain-containing protein [Nocardia violaceofusca]
MSEPTTDHPARRLQGVLAVEDRPAPAAPAGARDTARAMIGRLLARVAADATRAGDAERDCLRLAVEILHAPSSRDCTTRLEDAARTWARDGLSTDVVNALHAAVQEVLHRIGQGDATSGHRHYDVVVAAATLVGDLLDTMSTTIIGACVRQFDRAEDGHEAALSALLEGRSVSEIGARYGVTIAERYRVLALATQPDRHCDGDDVIGKDLRVQRLRHALAERAGGATLSTLSATGGTVLFPAAEVAATGVEHLVAEIGRAAHLSIAATVVEASITDIADAAERAHELLDIVQRLELPCGLYGFDELALEYQLTRPGPALAHLRALLAPLDGHPDLLATLRCHIAAGLNRRRTGKTLNLHPNTVDYRLRRIAELTGFHAHRYPDLWYLRSALVVHSVRPHRD